MLMGDNPVLLFLSACHNPLYRPIFTCRLNPCIPILREGDAHPNRIFLIYFILLIIFCFSFLFLYLGKIKIYRIKKKCECGSSQPRRTSDNSPQILSIRLRNQPVCIFHAITGARTVLRTCYVLPYGALYRMHALETGNFSNNTDHTSYSTSTICISPKLLGQEFSPLPADPPLSQHYSRGPTFPRIGRCVDLVTPSLFRSIFDATCEGVGFLT